MMSEPLRILIIGTGIVGQIYGALLHRAGHRVTFLTRERALARFEERPIRLEPKKGEPIVIEDGDFVIQADSFEPYDYVFACIRGDQRESLAEFLKGSQPETVRLILCFPIWRHHVEWFLQHMGSCHYLFPGILGVYREEAIEFKNGRSQLCPLGKASRVETETLATVLTQAGLPSKVKPNLFDRFQVIMAMGFPFLLALAARESDYDKAVRDRTLLRHAFAAQKECLAILKAGGIPTGAAGVFMPLLPSGLMAFGAGLSRFVVRGFIRDMFEIHFKKVEGQTYTALNELRAWAPAQSVEHPHLDALLDEAERAGVA